MIISRGLAAAAVLALVALESASPAEALGPPTDGLYTFNEAGVPAATWKVAALCDPISRQRAIPDFTDPVIAADLCALNVVSTTARKITPAETLANYSGRARLTSDLWTFEVKKATGVSCPDGTTAPSVDTYAFDDVTLAGTHTSIHDAVCGLEPAMTKTPFSLAFKSALPVPVERYPLDCDPIGSCR